MAYTYRATSVITGAVVEGTAEYIGSVIFANRYSVGESARKNRLLEDEWKVVCTGKEVFKRICPGCGKEFETIYAHKLSCSEKCNIAVQDAKKIKNNRTEKISPPHKRSKCEAQRIEEVQRLARAAGLSYGQYVAKMGL